jgi:DNA primase
MAIIDYTYPTITGNNWTVRVVKTTPKQKLFAQDKSFISKDDAFKYYEMIHQLWLKQKGRTK